MTVKTGTRYYKLTPVLKAERHLYNDQAADALQAAMESKGKYLGHENQKKYKSKNPKDVTIYSEAMIATLCEDFRSGRQTKRGAVQTMLHGGEDGDDTPTESEPGEPAIDVPDGVEAGVVPASVVASPKPPAVLAVVPPPEVHRPPPSILNRCRSRDALAVSPILVNASPSPAPPAR